LCIYIRLNNFFVYGPKYTNFFSPNVGGLVVDKQRFRFSICGSVPGIFAIKVESCQKSLTILDDFLAFLNLWGQAFQKLYPVYHYCLAARRLKKFHEDIAISPEVIEPNTLNFRPNFKFSRLIFLGGPSKPLWVCAGKPWSISSACRNLRRQHP